MPVVTAGIEIEGARWLVPHGVATVAEEEEQGETDQSETANTTYDSADDGADVGLL